MNGRGAIGTVRPMKVGADGLDVGIVGTGWAPQRGGVLSHTEDLARELVARGHRVHVLCLRTGEGDSLVTTDEEVALPGGGSVGVRRVQYGYGDHARLMDLMVHDRLRDVVLGWMAERPCDVVHVHHATGFGGSALRAIHDVGQPLVMTLHDYWMLDPRGQAFDPERGAIDANDLDGLARDLARTWPHLFEGGAPDVDAVRAFRAEALECLSLCDALFTPSAAAREVFVRAGVDGAALRVVENGVDAAGIAAAVEAARRAHPRTDDELRLGVLGSVLPSKGVVELAEAVVEARIDGLVLEVHGDPTPYHGSDAHLRRLDALAEAEPERVRVHGPFERTDAARVLARLDGVAVPSLWVEVFGLSAREARAAGLPVLVSEVGGLTDAVAGGGGLAVPPRDRAAWVDALARFADADQRAAWSAAPSAVRAVDAMTTELLALYADAIEARTGERPVHAEALRADESGPSGDGASASTGAPSAPAAEPRRGLLGRLFGRGR